MAAAATRVNVLCGACATSSRCGGGRWAGERPGRGEIGAERMAVCGPVAGQSEAAVSEAEAKPERWRRGDGDLARLRLSV